MTDQKRKIFIYDRKEVGILGLLGVVVALFAFTLGVHLGKQVVPKAADTHAANESLEPVDAAKEQNPNRNEIANEVKNVPGAVDETLEQNLRDEVAKTGIQIDPVAAVVAGKAMFTSDGTSVSAEASRRFTANLVDTSIGNFFSLPAPVMAVGAVSPAKVVCADATAVPAAKSATIA